MADYEVVGFFVFSNKGMMSFLVRLGQVGVNEFLEGSELPAEAKNRRKATAKIRKNATFFIFGTSGFNSIT